MAEIPHKCSLFCEVVPLGEAAYRGFLANGTRLRVNELLALGWGDVNLENLERRVTRSIWHQVLGNCKAEASAKPVPMDSYMAEDLLRWRRQSICASDGDYVFASETMRGKQPFWPDNLMKREIGPVAKANGIREKIGWHTPVTPSSPC